MVTASSEAGAVTAELRASLDRYAPLDVEALAVAVENLMNGPRRVQIIENDPEGMGRLILGDEAAMLLAAAYAAALRERP